MGLPFDPPIEPIYPVESALLLIGGGEAVAMIRNAIGAWRDTEAVNEKYQNAISAIEKYLGGPPKTIPNKKGDPVIMRDGKKIRFDVGNKGHGYPDISTLKKRCLMAIGKTPAANTCTRFERTNHEMDR